MDVGSLYPEARVIVMTRHDLGGRPSEEGALKGRSEGNRGTRRDISIQKLHWQPGSHWMKPNYFNNTAILGRGRPYRKEKWAWHSGRRLREVTSSRPFQKTWPPAVWWIMEPQMGHQARVPWRNAWEPNLPRRRESHRQLNKWTPLGSDIGFLICPIWSNNSPAKKWQVMFLTRHKDSFITLSWIYSDKLMQLSLKGDDRKINMYTSY